MYINVEFHLLNGFNDLKQLRIFNFHVDSAFGIHFLEYILKRLERLILNGVDLGANVRNKIGADLAIVTNLDH